ncbi:MAG: neutral/alkaline non-lysosomal ceramidase N-terminal domain-containing protein [bacterium]
MRPISHLHVVVTLVLSLSLTISCVHKANTESAPLLAGSAEISITPDPTTHDIPLGGYGDRKGEPATGVRDPVMARTLYLEQGDEKIAIVSCDLLFVPLSLTDAVRSRLKDSPLGDVKLFLAATHSHAAPEAMAMNSLNTFNHPAIGIYDPWLLDWTADLVALCIVEAARSPQPARVALGSREMEGLSRNRRGDGTTDPRITVLSVSAGPDRPIAMLTHFAAHPTILDSDMMEISAGWPGVLCRTLETSIGAGIKAIYLNGAQGDVSPVPSGSGSNIERMIAYGQQLSEEALACLEVSETMSSPVLSMTEVKVSLPPRTLSPQFAAIAGKEYQLDEASATAFVNKLFPEETTIPAIRIGSLILIGIPGEMASSLGLQVRKEIESSGEVTALVVGLVGDLVGYILPPEEYDQGGYEATVSFHGRTLGTVMTESAIKAGKALLTEAK